MSDLLTVADLKRMGFDRGVFGGCDSCENDIVLSGAISSASSRLREWSPAGYDEAIALPDDSPSRPAWAVACLYLTMCEILPVVWVAGSAGEKSVTVEGLRIDLDVPDESMQNRLLRGLADRAWRSVHPTGSNANAAGIVSV